MVVVVHGIALKNFVLYMLFLISWLYCIIPIKATIKD